MECKYWDFRQVNSLFMLRIGRLAEISLSNHFKWITIIILVVGSSDTKKRGQTKKRTFREKSPGAGPSTGTAYAIKLCAIVWLGTKSRERFQMHSIFTKLCKGLYFEVGNHMVRGWPPADGQLGPASLTKPGKMLTTGYFPTSGSENWPTWDPHTAQMVV